MSRAFWHGELPTSDDPHTGAGVGEGGPIRWRIALDRITNRTALSL
jgi:hypothetical protein